jgi:hypothetical protein
MVVEFKEALRIGIRVYAVFLEIALHKRMDVLPFAMGKFDVHAITHVFFLR